MIIKQLLIQLLLTLRKTEGLSSAEIEEIDHTLFKLNKKIKENNLPGASMIDYAQLPDNENGKLKAYICTFFLCLRIPNLMTNFNKKQLVEFSNQVEMSVKQSAELKPSSRSSPSQSE